MSGGELQQILRAIEENRVERDEQHVKFTERLNALEKKIDEQFITIKPIADTYDKFQGFGSVVRWTFTFVVIPISVLMGIILSYRNLHR